MAPAATDTFFVVDVGFPFAVVVNGIFRTVVVARPRGTAAAQVRHLVVDFHARRARFVHYAEDTFLRIDFFSFHHAGGVGRQTFGFVGFIRHVKAHHGHGLVFCHCVLYTRSNAPTVFACVDAVPQAAGLLFSNNSFSFYIFTKRANNW